MASGFKYTVDQEVLDHLRSFRNCYLEVNPQRGKIPNVGDQGILVDKSGEIRNTCGFVRVYKIEKGDSNKVTLLFEDDTPKCPPESPWP